MTLRSHGRAVLLLALVGLGCDAEPDQKAGAGNGSGASTAAREAKDQDAKWALLVAGKDEDGDRVMEAREYLAPDQASNAIWKSSREQMLKWSEDLYASGASKVWAAYSPADETVRVNMCAALLVELPSDKTARAAVMKAFRAIEGEIWGDDADGAKELGQRYLYLSVDS
jgi:hypothetical protein